MPNETQSIFLRERYLHGEKRMGFRQYLNNNLSFCFKKSKYILLVTDVFLLITFLESFHLLFHGNRLMGVALLAMVWMFLAFINNLYSALLLKNSEIIVKKAFCQLLIFSLIAGVLYSPFFSKDFDKLSYFLSLFMFSAALLANRVLFLSIRKKYKRAFVRKNRIALVGENQYFNIFENYIQEGSFDYTVIAKYEKKDLSLYSDAPEQSTIYNMWLKGVNEIYCNLADYTKTDLQQLLNEADKYMIRVKFIPAFLHLFDRRVRFNQLGEIPVISVRTEPLSADRNKIVKRAFDIAFSLMVIVLILSWLLPIIWLVIKIESKGPLLFKQKRSGMDNRPFSCFKFRSMEANNQGADNVQATKNDKRITKAGAFLRKTSMDELPQFFNVLRGTMSVVGPRPHMLAHTDQYRKVVDEYMIRHYVKPGITGLAQVSGCRGETKDLSAMQKRVEYDIEYIENWNFFSDLKIIFLTVWNVVKGEENAF